MTTERPNLAQLARTLGAPEHLFQRWAAAGMIQLDTPPRGSGAPAELHPAEIDAITDTYHRWLELRRLSADLHRGRYYAQRLAHHLGQ